MNLRNTKHRLGGPTFASFAFGTALSFVCGGARAADGCVLSDLDNNGGTQIAALLNDDITSQDFGWVLKTGYSSPTAVGIGGNLAARANSGFINAGLSDIQLDLWMPHTVDIADTANDYGGNGVNFMGGVLGVRCDKGLVCSFTLGTFANHNQAWQCLRSFENNSSLPVTIPLQQSASWLNSSGAQIRGVQEEWTAQVTKTIAANNSVQGVTGASGMATYEPMEAYCARIGAANDPGSCNSAAAMSGRDTVRLHWEGTVDPNVTAGSSAWCTAEAVLECVGFLPFCFYDIFVNTPVCDAVVGKKHVVIDTWLEIGADSPHSSNTPFWFERLATRVDVSGGSGSSTLRDRVLAAVKGTDVANIVQTGVYDAIGAAYCPKAAAFQSEKAFCDALPTDPKTGKKSFVAAGARALGVNAPLGQWPNRIEASYQAHRLDTGTQSFGYFPPTGKSTQGTVTGQPHIITINFDRGIQQ